MPGGEFVITELGINNPNPVKFIWTAAKRSAPRGVWQFSMEQRTIREDYPGAARPVEQVLGANFKDFTLQGVWDDRYNEPGYATGTWRAFEALVARGSMVKVEFEDVSFTGLIKEATFDYKRADMIGYQFTLSPHYRVSGDLAGANRKRPPNTLRPVTEFRDLVNTSRDAMAVIMAGGPFNQMSGDLNLTTAGRLNEINAATDSMIEIIRTRVQNGVERIDGLRRIVAAFGVIKTTAAALLTDLAVAKSSAHMAWETANGVLEFDTWLRGLTQYARLLFRTSHEAEAELSRRVVPKAIAIYHPRKGESLYAISQRFYNTPDQWRLIADRNGLTTVTLRGTEALIIPERT